MAASFTGQISQDQVFLPPFVKGGRPHRRSGANWALTKAPSQGIGRELEAFGHGQECQARTRHEVRVPCPDWKHEPTARMLSPGLSEARVQRLTSVGSYGANPNEVRVRGDFKDAPVQQKSKAACETTSKEHD
jgi:hypothetical protein